MQNNWPKRLLRFIVWMVLILVAAGGAGYVWLRTSLPQTQGSIALGGLSAPVDVLRDAHGVPHIFARSEADALFALGYAHAQDRLWQMEVNRRIGAGELSEIFGPAALETDRFIRILGLKQAAQSALDHFDPQSRALLEAYARGVNAFLHSRKGALPPEFLILGVKPRDWTPVDSVLWTKVMALDMGYMYKRELNRLKLLSHLTPQQINELLPPYPGDRYPPLPDLAKLYADLPKTISLPGLMEAPAGAPGSNNWVVAGSRSVTGKPLLANDPHITMSTPAIWYLAHINVNGANRVGVTFPGMPLVVLGHTDHVAWGFTNTEPDTHDIVIEKIINRYAGRYKTPDGEATFTGRVEVIKVKGAPDEKVKVRVSRNGPIISDAFPELAKALGGNHVLALRWVPLKESDSTMMAGLKIPNAADVASLREALRQFEAPQNNVVMADTSGNIGIISAGTVPTRGKEYPGAGLWPVPGWIRGTDWTGFVPYEQLPQQMNPASGWIGTANHKINTPDQIQLTYDWEDPYRHDRIAQMIDATPKHSIESFAAMQGDDLDLSMQAIIPKLIALTAESSQRKAALAMLRKWDARMQGDKPEPLIASAWVRAFEKRVISDDLGEAFASNEKHRPRFLLLLLEQADVGARWCDDQRSKDKREGCAEMAGLALDDALAELTRRYGATPSAWRWDAAHIVVHAHRPFSKAPGLAGAWLRRVFELRTPFGGSGDTLMNAHPGYKEDNPYDVELSQSYRGIFDLADLDNSRFAMPTGQSGNPFSPHFRDMEPKWRKMDYITIPTRREVLETAGSEKLTLTPQ